ncbi:MAG: PTS sugar transporter subunit IIB [Deltaproteobacteria bacterium]|jgi:mannose/fructose/N-acetylgalactosamine-specific phosphotransferase system component IIB|nr:PTS sugar transporter subunit IIB [Deltaproteobacteria bacterium]
MPVLATRVDQKLIHGQVTLGWAPFLAIEEIIVADDLALESELLMDIMSAGVQPPVKYTSFISPAKLGELIKARPTNDPRAMILFRDVAGVGEAVKGGLALASLNLGNHFNLAGCERLRLADSFFVSREDLTTLTSLAKTGLRIYFQSLPADPPVPFDPGRYRWTR